jgi:HEAT repeat protein
MSARPNPDTVISALTSSSARARITALAGFVESSPAKLPPGVFAAIVNCLAAESKTVRRRAADALAAIARRDSTLVAALLTELSNREPRIRFGAAYALGSIDENSLTLDAAAALCEALDDADGDVRWAAAELIVRLGRDHPEDVGARMIAMARSGKPVARKMALYCMRNLAIGSADALDAGLAAIQHDDAHVRLAALALLSACFTGHAGAAEQVRERLNTDHDPRVRRAAAVALGHLRSCSDHTLDALRRAGSQLADESLARAARASLERLTRS